MMASSMKRAGAVAILCISMGCGSDETDEGTEQDVVTQAGDVTEETADEVSEEMTPVLACSDNVPVVPPAEIIDAYEMCSEADLLLDPCGNKINSLILGKSGHPGEGLDIDENPDTCAPVEDCSAGIDNQLSSLAAVAQPGLDEAIIQGTLNLVLEYEELLDGDDNFVIKMYAGVIAESNEECDWYTEACAYSIRHDSFDTACNPLVYFNDGKIDENNHVTAGGPGTDLTLTIPLFGLIVGLPVQGAKLSATIERMPDGTIYRMSGLIGGAVPKATLIEILDDIPSVEYQAVGLVKSFILDAVNLALQDDLDTDGDGIGDAASIAANFDTLPASLEGYLLPLE